MSNTSEYSVPIVFIFFKRIDTTKQVLERIKEIKPKTLLLVADGPRNSEEKKLTDEVRAYVDSEIDWDCDVLRDYAEHNYGCKERIITGLNWAFDKVDRAIILEDDVKPRKSFFKYCEELLEKYKDDDKVMMVSGFNKCGVLDIDESYAFYDRTNIWGWATWARAWKKLDYNLENWPRLKRQKYYEKNFSKKTAALLIRNTDLALYKEVDTWDYIWEYSVILNQGLCIVPKYNMIENIGMNDIYATHTKGENKEYESIETEFPLVHPKVVQKTKSYIDYREIEDAPASYFREYVKSRLPRKIVRILQNEN